MENPPVKVPHKLLPDLVSAFVPPDLPADAVLEFVVTMVGEDIPIREFTAYLNLIDRIYGRLISERLGQYARREWERLHITEIHKSDLEIIFRILSGYQETAALIIIMLFLRSLPTMIKAVSESTKNFAEAFKAYEEGRLTRENRRKISEVIVQEPALETLDPTHRQQLI